MNVQADIQAQVDMLRAKAAACRQRSRDSFERSDTDGSLSQWANDSEAQRLERKAELLLAGNKAMFTVLMKGDKIVQEHWSTRPQVGAEWLTSYYWFIPNEWFVEIGRRYVPMIKNKSSNVQKKLGLREVQVEREACVVLTCGRNVDKKGMSGADSLHVSVVRVDERHLYTNVEDRD